MSNTEYLLDLKKQIEDAKIKKAQIEGKIQSNEEQLKKEFNCSFDQAENIINSLSAQIDKDEKELKEKVEEIKKYF